MRFNFMMAVMSTLSIASMLHCSDDAFAQAAPVAAQASDKPATDQLPREQRIANYLTGAKFVGSYTIDAKGLGDAKEEAYTISKVEKLPDEDLYRLTARIQYGETDGEFPMDLKILWAGNTPVITLDKVWIPGLGTFSARVLILNGRYAGTWDHDAVGGHMIGRIVKEPIAP